MYCNDKVQFDTLCSKSSSFSCLLCHCDDTRYSTICNTHATYVVLGDDEAYEPGCRQAGSPAPSNDLHVTDGLRGMFSLAPTMFALMSRPQRGELPCDAVYRYLAWGKVPHHG